MPTPPAWSPRVRAAVAGAALVLVLVCWLHVADADATLARAAGREATAQGGEGGRAGGGFADLFAFLDTLATYLMYLGGAVGVLGLIKAGVEYISGNPAAGRTAGGVVIGVVIILLAKGITL